MLSYVLKSPPWLKRFIIFKNYFNVLSLIYLTAEIFFFFSFLLANDYTSHRISDL